MGKVAPLKAEPLKVAPLKAAPLKAVPLKAAQSSDVEEKDGQREIIIVIICLVVLSVLVNYTYRYACKKKDNKEQNSASKPIEEKKLFDLNFEPYNDKY